MKIGFLYGGQGSQRVGMGQDFYEAYPRVRDFYDSLDLDFNIKEISFRGDEKTIEQTQYTQPLLVAFQIGITDLLKDNNIEADYFAGLSIGEYGALYGGGVLSSKDALRISEYRGRIMAEASQGIETKMLAVMGLDLGKIEEICKNVSSGDRKLQVSNLNAPNQVIVAGEKSAAEKGEKLFKEAGAKMIIPLKVSGPFHTDYMEDAALKLEQYFREIEFKDEENKIVYNTLGSFRQGQDIKDLMCRQVKSPVYFQKSLEFLIDQGVDTFVEIGFGSVIKGFLKKIDRKKKVYEIYSVETLKQFLQEVNNGQ